MAELTARQQQVLNLIRRFITTSGRPPTRAEIAETLGFRSANAAEEHLRALERKGMLEIEPGTSRGLRLTHNDPQAGLPLVGRVAAGNPILAEEHIESRVRIEPGAFRPRADYLLRVKGMSMRDAGILDGDLLAVHKAARADNGKIVVARLENEVTVKRFHQRGQIVRLLPANPDFEPIEVDLRHESLTIEGIGVGLLRNGLALR
mgnify:FL=1